VAMHERFRCVNPIFVVAFVIAAIFRVVCPAQKVGSSHHAVKNFKC
jgi:hypothetical protein